MPSSSEQRKKRIGSITAALFVLFYVLPLVIGSVFAAVALGVIIALVQRIREIKKGEVDDAKQY